MSVPNIEDLTEPPVVGKFYMVPCVFGTSDKWQTKKSCKWLPVIGALHSDSEYIGFSPLHLHYDHRFTPESEWMELGRGFSDPMFIVISDPKMKPVRKRMKCLRVQCDYPKNAHFRHALADAYADKRVKCGTCPHRGLPLSSLPREPGTDIVTCVGHGLKWDLKSGNLVR